MTGLLQVYKNSNIIWDDTIQTIKEKKEISLNERLWLYNSWTFSNIKLINDSKLEWYNFLWTWEEKTIMAFNKSLKQDLFDLYHSQKPINTSLNDLWISLTWATKIEVEFTEASIFQKILEQVWPLILFIIIIFFFAKFALPKWWWMPFNMKIWKQTQKEQSKTRFSDVAGMEEVKMELSEIVDYLKNPEKYHKVWARHPKWVLLYGQPWSWKTLLARAVAWEASVPFFTASWSEFMEMLVWMWAARVRELFWKAKAAWRAIVFIDEIDAIWKRRWSWFTWWHQEQEQTLNQILTEMDWFDNTTKVIIIAATNRPDTLDPALLRAWRFDRKVMVSAPTYEERIEIFNYYLKKKKITKEVKIESLAKRTSGLVWADIENIANEASLKIAKENREYITVNDFEYALEKVLMWPEKRVKSIREDEKKTIAYHELWHAITSHILPNADPVEKISIVRRWQALWVTWISPSEDKYLYSKSKFIDEVTSLLWWRAAEEIFFWIENITTWASNDFEKATTIIRDMITKYWMDEELWPILYSDQNKDEYKLFKNYSEKTAEIIDKKIKDYLFKCYDNSKKIIKQNKKLIEKMSEVLLWKEYLTNEEFNLMMNDISTAKDLMKWIAEDKKNWKK